MVEDPGRAKAPAAAPLPLAYLDRAPRRDSPVPLILALLSAPVAFGSAVIVLWNIGGVGAARHVASILVGGAVLAAIGLASSICYSAQKETTRAYVLFLLNMLCTVLLLVAIFVIAARRF